MTITVNELSLQAINAALLRIQRSIQTGNNNFQNDVEKAVANVTINGKTTLQKYDDSRLMAIVNELNQRYETLTREQSDLRTQIINLETILSNVSLSYDPESNTLSYTLGDSSIDVTLKDTTYSFSYDTETGTFTIVDEYTGETVLNQVFNDTTYTFSFTNGVLTVHNNLSGADQTFNFDSRYYTESEIQSLILDKIPSQASAQNQLADKEFVNSSIATATATFRGTVTTTQALAALTGDLNDYAFLENIDSTTGQVESYDRYKWVESGGDYGHWKYEYTLNNSSFTAAQWDAINSGITCQIVTDLLDGCYTGHGSKVAKNTANEWKSILATNCNCSSAVDADCIYYNTNVQVNQCCGCIKANIYCVNGKGYATYALNNLFASNIGLTAGCCYPLTCILSQIMLCYGTAAGTYTFAYADAQNPIVCETNQRAYHAVFTKEDSSSPIANTWNLTRWRVSFNNGRLFYACAYSVATAGIAQWSVSESKAVNLYRNATNSNAKYPLALFNGCTNGFACGYVSCGCQATFNPSTGRLIVCQSRANDYILVGNTETGAAGTINPNEGGILLCKSPSGKMIQLNGNIGTDVGLLLYHCGDLNGNTYCNLGIEIGSGNVNRGFYHRCAGIFQWLQYWDASKEIHNCPVCFDQCVNGSSSFAGTTAMFNNTNRLGSVYSGTSYNTGYYLLAQICDYGCAGYHDIVLGGYLDGGIYPRMTWKGFIRANKCTLSSACFWVNNALASNCLVATREIDTTTCKLILRIYGKVSANYQRFNTTITYAAIGDCNNRVSPYCSCVTLPGTYVTSVTGTAITATKNIGSISVDNITVCNASSLTCSFPATSSAYILLGCYSPLNNTLANEIDLGFAIGGCNLVSNTNLKLMLTHAGCCSTSQFLQNNIEVKYTNYVTGCYGPRCILFTSSGSSWSCKIGIWVVVCNPASAVCSWCFGLLRNRTDDRFSTCLCCQSTAPTGIVCTIGMGTLRNFYFNNARESCFSGVLSTSILCTGSFIPLPTIICGNCNQCYIHLGCYKPDLLCANEVDLTLTVGDAGNNSVNIKALLTTGCINEFYKNNIIVNTASVDRSHAYIDSVVFTTIGTCWSCSIDIYAVVCSTAACTCYSLYNNKQNACFKKCFEALADLPTAPLKCSISVNGDSVTALSAPLLASTWKMETNASASFALGCNSYTTLVIGGVNDVRSPTYQKLFISTCITGSENPLNMWIDYMGGYGDKDFITACYSGANCNVIVPMRISSDSQNIYIDLATCTCAARDLCATLYSSSPMPLGSCGNSIRTTCYTACFITDASSAYVYVMCQWPTTITLNVDDPASQFATRILSANTISAYCMATTSDIRQKKDIVPYNNGLCDISKLDIISFRYKNEDSSCIKHVSIPANWTNPLLSGEKQNQLRINDAVGILLGAVKDLSKSMTLGQKIKLWLYKKFIEPKNNDNIKKKLKDFN